jgi:hypothetical protein
MAWHAAQAHARAQMMPIGIPQILISQYFRPEPGVTAWLACRTHAGTAEGCNPTDSAVLTLARQNVMG